MTRRDRERHRLGLAAADPSYAGEWPHARALLDRLGIGRDGWAVDLGAGDGVASSCTLPLFRDRAWSGLAVECDATRFGLLDDAYRGFPDVVRLRARVTPDTVADLLAAAGTPERFAFLNVDLDSFDLAVVRAVLARFQPAVVDIEVNEKVPPPVRFTVLYAPDHAWDESHFFGCSLAAAADVIELAGYRLQGLAYNNAFFVRDDVADVASVPRAGVADAYRAGYVDRPERARLFPWNADVEALLAMPAAEVVAALDGRFRRYAGRYRLGLDPVRPTDPLEAARADG